MEDGKGKADLDDLNRETLIFWVRDFLALWEGSKMLYKPAAEIIVQEIFKMYSCFGADLNQNEQYQLPDVELFFPDESNYQV